MEDLICGKNFFLAMRTGASILNFQCQILHQHHPDAEFNYYQ
jgi:hypothetical protein